MGSLAHERGGLWVEGVMAAARGVDDLVVLAQASGLDGDPVVRRQIAELSMRVRALRALGYKGFAIVRAGIVGPRAQLHEGGDRRSCGSGSTSSALDLQGPDLAVVDRELAVEGGRWQRSWMTGLASTIGGGTSEIQRNVIATARARAAEELTMDFRLTDEQTLMVDTARSLFTRECPPDVVRRVADEPKVASDLFDRHLSEWVELAAGPSVDLCLFLVEAGAVVAPGPSCPPPAASPRCSERRATRWPTTPWPRGHRHRRGGRARRAWACRGTDLELVDKVARDRPDRGSRWSTRRLVEAPARSRRSTWPVDVVRDGPRRARPRADRGGCARPTPSSGPRWPSRPSWSGGPLAGRRTRRVRQGTRAVRRAHRLVPGRAAPAGRLGARLRARPPRPCPTRRCRRCRRPRPAPGRCTSPRPRPATAASGAKDGIQIHGGIGYTWEHDLHLWLRRAYGDDALFGTGAWHLDQLADLLFD